LTKISLHADDSNMRLDKFLVEKLFDHSRSYIQGLIKDGLITVNGKVVKANYILNLNDEIIIEIPPVTEMNVEAEDIPLDILYEDEDILVINKPKGMVVHPSYGHATGTLVNAILFHCRGQLSGINGVSRPGIVHRIDKDTTGSMVVCKNDSAHQNLAAQFKDHTITRLYEAVVIGNFPQEEFTIDAPIGRHHVDRKKMSTRSKSSREAITHCKVVERFSNYTQLACSLETGRTHQIRTHLASIGHPILGDIVYGSGKNPFKLEGQTLHAKVLGFHHPSTKEYMEFQAPLPAYFLSLLEKLRKY